jgi:hypothetical protein
LTVHSARRAPYYCWSTTSAEADHAGETKINRKTNKSVSRHSFIQTATVAAAAAALAAARAGARVLLVEKAPFAGGIITSVGLPYFDGIAHIRTKRVVVRGISLELLSKSGVCTQAASGAPRHRR